MSKAERKRQIQKHLKNFYKMYIGTDNAKRTKNLHSAILYWEKN